MSLLGAEVKLNSWVPAASGTWMLEGELVLIAGRKAECFSFRPLLSIHTSSGDLVPGQVGVQAMPHVNSSRPGGYLEIFFSDVLLTPHGNICIIFSLYFLFESVLVITFSIFKLYKAVSLRLLSVCSFNSFKLLPDVSALW